MRGWIDQGHRVASNELLESRMASARPSLDFFVLLVSAAIIATLGLISNSSAVVIGAMIVAPLMDPILSLAFGVAISNGRLIRRSVFTVILGMFAVLLTSALISLALGISHVQSEITARTSPNLIDLGIAVAAAVAGSFSVTREGLSKSIAGVAIAVALVPPLCVCGIGLTLGNEIVAVFGRGSIAGLSNQIAEGSFLLFLANLIGITVASLVVFLLQRYGSIQHCWRNLLIWLGLLGLLSWPLSSSLKEFSIRQKMDTEFARFRASRIQKRTAGNDSYQWSKVRLIFSNVSITRNNVKLYLVFSAPENLINQEHMDRIYSQLKQRARRLGVQDLEVNVSIIPYRVFYYGPNRLPRETVSFSSATSHLV